MIIPLTKRYQDDIIGRLFNEAMEKDAALKKLHEQIIEMDEVRQDSLLAYNSYIKTNHTYWAVSNRYAKQINDTILRKSMLEVFMKLELEYKNSLSSFDSKLALIAQQSIALEDQLC